jgi:hypothetical protein
MSKRWSGLRPQLVPVVVLSPCGHRDQDGDNPALPARPTTAAADRHTPATVVGQDYDTHRLATCSQ